MTSKSRAILIMLTVSALIICYVIFEPKHTVTVDAPWEKEDYTFTKYDLDTVEVIVEDGIRWYTIDTIWYEDVR